MKDGVMEGNEESWICIKDDNVNHSKVGNDVLVVKEQDNKVFFIHGIYSNVFKFGKDIFEQHYKRVTK